MIPVVFHNGSGYDFNPILKEVFKQNNGKRTVRALANANCKADIFSVGCLIFPDRYNFLSMSVDNMAKTCTCEKKILYPHEHFKWKDYDKAICDLTTKCFRPTLSRVIPPTEDVDKFNNESRHKPAQELTLEY